MKKISAYKLRNKGKAEEICINYYRGEYFNDGLSEENNDFLVDYLSDRNLDVDLDSSNNDICKLVIQQKMDDEGSLDKLEDYIENIKQFKLSAHTLSKLSAHTLSKHTSVISLNKGKIFKANIPADIYLKIALASDWQTIKNMIIASNTNNSNDSSKFNETFFKTLLQQRYPLLLKYKDENISFKKYFLKVVYILAKLSEDFQFPYIPSKYFNPIKFYNKYKKLTGENPIYLSQVRNQMYAEGLTYAGEIGDTDLINYFLEKLGIIDLNTHENLLGYQERMIQKAIEQSLLNEQLDTIKYLMQRNLISLRNLQPILDPVLAFQMDFHQIFKNTVSPEFYQEFTNYVDSLN